MKKTAVQLCWRTFCCCPQSAAAAVATNVLAAAAVNAPHWCSCLAVHLLMNRCQGPLVDYLPCRATTAAAAAGTWHNAACTLHHDRQVTETGGTWQSLSSMRANCEEEFAEATTPGPFANSRCIANACDARTLAVMRLAARRHRRTSPVLKLLTKLPQHCQGPCCYMVCMT